MSDTEKMRVSVTRSGDSIRIRASKGGVPFTQEEHTQLQILEYEVTNTRRGRLLSVSKRAKQP